MDQVLRNIIKVAATKGQRITSYHIAKIVGVEYMSRNK